MVPHGGITVLGKNTRASQTSWYRYWSGSLRSPIVDWSGPTLPAGHTSSPGTRWHPVHGPLARLRKSARPFCGSPVTPAGIVTRWTGGSGGGARVGDGRKV